jgi:16S rRNA (cytidine1402-2'-O)-methyltransferase
MSAGRLYVVATPLGNLEDISARAIRILGEVKRIAAEDTRHSRKLLDHFDIDTPLTSYHDHNEREKAEELVGLMAAGNAIALITDAGTPCVSDPGYRLVRAAHEHGIEVLAVPGPSAVSAALSVSGLPSDRFVFHGFAPRKAREAAAWIESMAQFPGTHIVYEAPYRVQETLKRLSGRLPDAEVCLTRELTKLHEEILRGTAAEVLAQFSDRTVRGECVILIYVQKTEDAETYTEDDLRERVATIMRDAGLSHRDAVKRVAVETGVSKRVVYGATKDST